MIRISSVLGLDIVDNSATPNPGQLAVYAKDKRLYTKDDEGNELVYAAVAELPVLPPLTYSISGELEPVTGSLPIYNDSGRAWTIMSVRASVGTAPTGQAVIVDVHKDGVTIFGDQSKRPTITPSTTTAVSTEMTVTTVDVGEALTVDIDQVGSGDPGEGLVVQVAVV